MRSVSVQFGGLAALSDVDFDVKRGTVKALIGPNGAGKTTLFNVISGIQAPTSGSVLLDGEDITRSPPHERVRRGLARTFQNLQVFSGMSVLENVIVGMHARLSSGVFTALFRLPSGRREEMAARDRARALLGRVGLASKADLPVSALSFGDLKIVEIARALASEPTVLLLDEPTAGLPAAEATRVTDVIRAISTEGVTVLLVEHNMRVVMSVSHDILVLNFGRRIAEGEPAFVRAHPDVITAYLGADVEAQPHA
ncbi:MAG TPA: ABC transporter ATP-binding protein [Casimicrobiaceae bacterium]|nr:ABC transporter ATP-binding protein [Casimicrobiaceae bacterium]